MASKSLQHPGTDEKTSLRMARMPREGTQPELAVRKILRELGIRYRVNSPTLPGRPDLSSSKHKVAVFVHGCFWHGHASCDRFSLPASNQLWWQEKIRENRRRDERKERELKDLGFRIVVVWECEVAKLDKLKKKLAAVFKVSG